MSQAVKRLETAPALERAQESNPGFEMKRTPPTTTIERLLS